MYRIEVNGQCACELRASVFLDVGFACVPSCEFNTEAAAAIVANKLVRKGFWVRVVPGQCKRG